MSVTFWMPTTIDIAWILFLTLLATFRLKALISNINNGIGTFSQIGCLPVEHSTHFIPTLHGHSFRAILTSVTFRIPTLLGHCIDTVSDTPSSVWVKSFDFEI